MPCRGNKDVEIVENQNEKEDVFKDVDNDKHSTDQQRNYAKNAKNTNVAKAKTVDEMEEIKKGGVVDGNGSRDRSRSTSQNQRDNDNTSNANSQNAKVNERRGRLCCGASDVEVNDSVRPLDPVPVKKYVANDANGNEDEEEVDDVKVNERVDNDEIDDNDDDFDDKENNEDIDFHPHSKARSKKKKKMKAR